MYKYTRLSYNLSKSPVVCVEEKCEMDSQRLYIEANNVGEVAFMRLLHKWNSQNFGVPSEHNNFIHIYVPYWRCDHVASYNCSTDRH